MENLFYCPEAARVARPEVAVASASFPVAVEGAAVYWVVDNSPDWEHCHNFAEGIVVQGTADTAGYSEGPVDSVWRRRREYVESARSHHHQVYRLAAAPRLLVANWQGHV